MTDISQLLQFRLTALGDEKKARWLENYVKHDVQSKGVGVPQIRELAQLLPAAFHSSFSLEKITRVLAT